MENVPSSFPQVSDVDRLTWLEGGIITEEDDVLAVMYKSDGLIEMRITGTLAMHYDKWVGIGAGNFPLSVIKNR